MDVRPDRTTPGPVDRFQEKETANRRGEREKGAILSFVSHFLEFSP